MYPGRFEYWQLASARAIIVVPYTKSVMHLFELYRMNIPLFAPSIALLTSWTLQGHAMQDRIYWKGTPKSSFNASEYSPNDKSERATAYWLQYSDIYTFPHIVHFDSWDHALYLLKTTDLVSVSQRMKEENSRVITDLRSAWKRILGHASRSRIMPDDFDTAMLKAYGKTLSKKEPPCNRMSMPDYGVWN
tara:strand:+ start:260 stop:829 length:570 start_codon:yes stop_codon:yes gene_type:complete